LAVNNPSSQFSDQRFSPFSRFAAERFPESEALPLDGKLPTIRAPPVEEEGQAQKSRRSHMVRGEMDAPNVRLQFPPLPSAMEGLYRGIDKQDQLSMTEIFNDVNVQLP